jgi:hypothetical protein
MRIAALGYACVRVYVTCGLLELAVLELFTRSGTSLAGRLRETVGGHQVRIILDYLGANEKYNRKNLYWPFVQNWDLEGLGRKGTL